jgi:hypothetical protein
VQERHSQKSDELISVEHLVDFYSRHCLQKTKAAVDQAVEGDLQVLSFSRKNEYLQKITWWTLR